LFDIGTRASGCARRWPLFQTEYLNPSVLSEMMVEGEGSCDPRGRCGSPIEDGVLVPGARRSCPAAPGADETKDRMVVRKRRDCGGAALSCSGANRGRLDETASASAYARQHAPLNQPPDGRAGNAQRSSRFLHGNHRFSHTRIVSSQSSHPEPHSGFGGGRTIL
jgi:hypothetical protein